MADDTVALPDHPELPAAHVAGVSLGGTNRLLGGHQPPGPGALAGLDALGHRHPPGGPAARAFLAMLLRRAPRDRDAYMDFSVKVQKVIGGRQWLDEARTRRLAGQAYDRCRCPIGVMRQLVAIQPSGDRTAQLRRLEVPTVVLHGTDDPLVPARA